MAGFHAGQLRITFTADVIKLFGKWNEDFLILRLAGFINYKLYTYRNHISVGELIARRPGQFFLQVFFPGFYPVFKNSICIALSVSDWGVPSSLKYFGK